jgi:hypothetical protein
LSESVETRNGVRVIPDEIGDDWPAEEHISTVSNHRPADALDQVLLEITARYGDRTTNVVAMQLEYALPREASNPDVDSAAGVLSRK